MKARNYVVKHALQFNKAATHQDRKRNSKRGYTKHRNQLA
jgi:hypothetical protein